MENKLEVLIKTNEFIKCENILNLNKEQIDIYNFILMNCLEKDDTSMEIFLSIYDYREIAPNKDKNKYTIKNLDDLVIGLQQTNITYVRANNNIVRINLIDEVIILAPAYIKVKISRHIYDLIMHLDKGYTPINIKK